MALGNNSGKGTARHKGQTIRSIKERRDASGFTEIQLYKAVMLVHRVLLT